MITDPRGSVLPPHVTCPLSTHRRAPSPTLPHSHVRNPSLPPRNPHPKVEAVSSTAALLGATSPPAAKTVNSAAELAVELGLLLRCHRALAASRREAGAIATALECATPHTRPPAPPLRSAASNSPQSAAGSHESLAAAGSKLTLATAGVSSPLMSIGECRIRHPS